MAKSPCKLRELPPDDPFYTRGWFIGGRRLTGSLKPTQAINSPNDSKKLVLSSNLTYEDVMKQIEDWRSKRIKEAASYQMSTNFPSEKIAESPSSTSASEKD